MANGKDPKTTGEHIIALYGHITGVKRDLKEILLLLAKCTNNKIYSCKKLVSEI